MSDRIEISRQRAGELHQQALIRGKSPLDFYAFAKAEAERRGIEVSRVPIGDARLCGGRALFDPDAWAILHEDTGKPFSDAFLIAHEIGHVEFGGEQDEYIATEVDTDRASGSTGVETDRVVDYSRQQRREVQMDLFAREFLLPRHWMRTLHLNEGKTASEIVQSLKAPRSVVLQQLLDAVLLPVVEIEASDTVKSPVKFNDQQLEAMRYPGETALLLKAGPGTGKTRTLIGRIEHLLAQGESPEGILVLTFSNKAAGEIAERLAVANPDAAATVWVGTFHSFGLDLLRRFHERLGLPADPRLLSTAEAVAMIEEFYPGLKLSQLRNLQYPSGPITTALKSISRANDEVVDAQRYSELSEKMLASAVEDGEVLRAQQCVDVSKIYSAYEQRKRDQGLLDFGDLVSMPVRLCEDDKEVRDYLNGLYQHVLVDEFQDVNRASVRILKSICPTGKNLWVVGDARQSIYRFRGASSYNLQRFCEKDFPGGKIKHLTLNYRSVPEINAVVDNFAAKMGDSVGGDQRTESDRDSVGLHPEIRAVERKADEADTIADAIGEMQKKGYAFRDQALICKGNARLAELAGELEHRGIPVLFLGNLFERDEVRDLLSLVSLLTDGRAMGLLRLAAMDEFAMSVKDVSTIIDTLREKEARPMDWVKNDWFSNISENARSSLDDLRKIVRSCHPRTKPWELLAEFIFDRTRLAANLATDGDIRSRSKAIAIWQFMNFARAIRPNEQIPAMQLLDQVRQLVLHSDDRELRQLPKAADGIDAVRLMTMHGSKGLESPVVHVAGLTSASIPISGKKQLSRSVTPPNGMIDGTDLSGYEAVSQGLEEEQECLFFVSLSRAMDRLFLYRYTKQSDGRKQSGSKFLKILGPSVEEIKVAPAFNQNREASQEATKVLVQKPFTLTDYQVALYQKCPARFLYAHVLQSGGKRTETAYMSLHDAVQEVVDTVLSGDGGIVTLAEAEKMLDQALKDRGFGTDEAAAEYRSIAGELVRSLFVQSSGSDSLPTKTHAVKITGGTVTVTPDQVVREESGDVVFRRVRTGHAGSKTDLSLESTLLQVSADSAASSAELVHLGDQDKIPIKMSDQQISNRMKKLDAIGASIVGGHFPTDADENCPHCAAYFICGKLPAGKITRKIPS
ncbi:UvrD-helicase domain-containing protein [Novipirellula sp.]|uniref:UvrD-helicase domain-containing protein n=1 Tax=Novipirellula sp. TaxID=2795430 RepID=UPI00356ABD29